MSMFDGQAEGISLSDEALFGEETEPITEERQDDAPPQTEPVAQASPEPPAEGEQTSTGTDADTGTAPQDGQAVETNPELDKINNQYTEIRAAFTRKAQEAAEEKRLRLAAEAQLKQLQRAASLLDPVRKEEMLQKMLENPYSAIEEAALPLVEQRVAEALKPIMEENQKKEEEQAFNTAMKAITTDFPNANSKEEQTQLIRKMVEISETYGDRNLWRRNPAGMLKQAALELYGVPQKVDQSAIDAAVTAAKNKTAADIAAKEAAKTGLTINQQNNQQKTATQTYEEKIIDDIFNVKRGGLFS